MKDLKLKGVSVVGRGSGATLKYPVGPSQNPGGNPGGGGRSPRKLFDSRDFVG